MIQPIRYAVVGLGHIAQVAILPAFKTAENSKLVALVSGDEIKLRTLAKEYSVTKTYSYEQYEDCLKSGEIDAVFIALPNRMHRDFAIKASQAGIHVLCEKPMAVSSKDCEAMIQQAEKDRTKLMIAYRLHFDPANLNCIQIAQSGKLGELRYFTAELAYPLKENNIRRDPAEGISPLHDIGIYCINAARYLFQDEPEEVFAFASSPDKSFQKTYEMVSATLKFSGGKLASFVCSFGTSGVSVFRISGTQGDLFVEDAFEYVGKVNYQLTVGNTSETWSSKLGDQFAGEIEYFSNCLIIDKEPEPAGIEGLTDLKIIEALERSIQEGKPQKLALKKRSARPTLGQSVSKKSHGKPKLVRVQSAS